MPDEHWLFPANITPELQEMVDLLRGTTIQITSLEMELTRLRLQKAELEKELGQFRLKHSEVRLGPITRCPDEILLLIFKQFLDNDHSRIRRLLFVCKHWYNTVMNSPSLWARIVIYNALTLFPYKYCTSPPKVPYIVACHERSESLPLDVELDLTEFPNVEEYLKEELYKVAQEITDRREHDYLFGKIFEGDWDHGSEWINNELSRTLDYTFGTNGTNLKRWNSLKLVLPNDEDAANIVWRRIQGFTLNAAKWEITNPPRELDWQDAPSMPLIQQLAFQGTTEQVRAYLGGFPTTLKFLEIIIKEAAFFMQLSSLSALTKLRVLTLHIRGLSAEPPRLTLPQLDLRHLDTLTLYASSRYIGRYSGDTKYIQSATWNLVQRLCMLHGAVIRHIRWSLSGEKRNMTPPKLGLLQQQSVNITREIVVAADKMETDTLQEWAKQQALNAVEEISGMIDATILMVKSESRRGNDAVLDT